MNGVRPLWIVAGAASLGAGLIHLVLGPEHLEELGPLGYGFYLSATLQIGWAAAVGIGLVAWRDRPFVRSAWPLALSGIVINVTILAAWMVSRVVGLPAGESPWTPEPIGLPDTIAGLLEAVIIIGCGALLRGRSIARVAGSVALRGAATLLAIAVIGVGTAVAMSPVAGHGHRQEAVHGEKALHGEDGQHVEAHSH